MPHYKLTYFNLKARGEVIRQILFISGVDWEDHRISFEEWPKIKPTTQFHQLPVLEFDGVQIAQSAAIARFLARQYGLAGKGLVEEAQVDSYVELFRDYFEQVFEFQKIVNGFAKGDKDAVLKDKVIPARDKFFNYLKKILAKAGSGFLVSSGLTWADLLIVDHLSFFKEKVQTYLNGYPEIIAYVDRVHQNPRLKRWLETRPKTDF